MNAGGASPLYTQDHRGEPLSMDNVYMEILNAGHTLIAGAQGSGKSTVLSGLIHTALINTDAQFIIIDPKRVDMMEYQNIPQVIEYATQYDDIETALHFAIALMETRFDDMADRRLKEYDGAMLYVFIDEVADLMTNNENKRRFTPLIQRLAQLGRAARVTVIMASQVCLSTIISSLIKANFPSRLALRTATAQDSRNIIDVKGAEKLPNPKRVGYAQGIWRDGADIQTVDLPRFDNAERYHVIERLERQQRQIMKQAQQKPRRKSIFSLFGRRSA